MNAAHITGFLNVNSATAEFLPPPSEWVMRPLTKLGTFKQHEMGKVDGRAWVTAWDRACRAAKKAGKPITDRLVKSAVDSILKKSLVEGLPSAERWNGKWKVDTIYQADVTASGFLASLPENAIDFVITDPPYAPDSLEDGVSYPLYEMAGRIAARCLKPGGYCAIYLGKLDLGVLLSIMTGYLDYAWCVAIYRPKGQWNFRKEQYKECWRPIGVFRKPGPRFQTTYAPDAFEGAFEKDFHEWQQEIGPVKALIEKYTSPGQLILDMYCGGGTKPMAAKLLGRHYLSFDKDDAAVQLAIERLSNGA